jgi:hypothetical protein
VDSILHSVRRRQRALARVVLALFCLAWLQAAVVPCAMATAPSTAMPDGAHHCPYCPQGDAPSAATDHAGSCVYPHQAQVDARAVDARAAAILSVAFPASSFTPMTDVAAHGLHLPAAVSPDPVPRIPIPLRFCRYLE